MKKYIIVNASTNDESSVSEKTLITDFDIKNFKEILTKLILSPLFGLGFGPSIKWGTEHIENTVKNVVRDEILTKKEAEFFNVYVPFAEHGTDMIMSIEVLTVAEEEKLL